MKRISGFTLIELIVVIGVLGTLAAGIVVVMDPVAQMGKARDATRKSDLAQLQRALEMYYDDFQEYPPTSGNMSELSSATAKYIQSIPTDPISTKYQYRYVAVSGQQMYRIYAHLETKMDQQACSDTSDCPNVSTSGISGDKCGVGSTQICNYGVSSPNTSP